MRPTVGITLRPNVQADCVRDRVVQQYRERREPDRAAQIHHGRHHRGDRDRVRPDCGYCATNRADEVALQ